jgi:hypothetical protein
MGKLGKRKAADRKILIKAKRKGVDGEEEKNYPVIGPIKKKTDENEETKTFKKMKTVDEDDEDTEKVDIKDDYEDEEEKGQKDVKKVKIDAKKGERE